MHTDTHTYSLLPCLFAFVFVPPWFSLSFLSLLNAHFFFFYSIRFDCLYIYICCAAKFFHFSLLCHSIGKELARKQFLRQASINIWRGNQGFSNSKPFQPLCICMCATFLLYFLHVYTSRSPLFWICILYVHFPPFFSSLCYYLAILGILLLLLFFFVLIYSGKVLWEHTWNGWMCVFFGKVGRKKNAMRWWKWRRRRKYIHFHTYTSRHPHEMLPLLVLVLLLHFGACNIWDSLDYIYSPTKRPM